MKTFIIVVLVVAIGVIIGSLYYVGFFAKIQIEEREVGPFKVVYEEHIGDYRGTGKIMDEIYHSLLDDGIETYKGFGIYYDDPKTTEKDKLRSIAGCILEENDHLKISELQKR